MYTDKYGEPSFLMVLTGSEYSYKREDEIYVVSIGTLKKLIIYSIDFNTLMI
ncbi:MAG: hypothetical protein L6V81_05010 [Clostridium sp.]|nr:MAG: hypothetical protein L6V81_05010 [Clostridium sp.]